MAHHEAVRRDLPSGTVTFLFTDVESSTGLLQELGAERYADALVEHRRVLREAFGAHGGVEVDTQGDAFFVAFPTAPGALEAAAEGLEGLAAGPIRVRMGIHTGTPLLGEEGYVGVDVHRAARIAACGDGGQVLVSASTASLVGTDGLHDLGEHRLKDLSAPERIYQLGEDDFPPLKSLYRTNLPIPATAFLGREAELAEVGALLAREDVRLLTLTGPGGTGKSRLALQAAAEASERFPDGVFWVPLAPLRDPELVLESAAQALDANDGLAEHVAGKRLLLLFDNFEHLVDAAEGLAELLAACVNVQLLLTSREVLRLPGEQVYPVPPLEPEEGAELFVTRARAGDPGFVTTASVPELCARLEHLPLALELAAARLRVLSPEQLLDRLSERLDLLKAGRGADPRQQTLRATIEWSHELLPAEEQKLFRRLAVFAGGCTLGSAEAVCGADLDDLEALVDKSLVRVRESDRFWMLETIREYATEQLEASGEVKELRRRHAEHFLALAEEAEPNLFGASPEAWADRLERELDNFRSALGTFEASGESHLALRLVGALSEFWHLKNHVPEGRRHLDHDLRNNQAPTAARAKALNGAASLARIVGETATAKRHAEEALALHRRLDDAWGAAVSMLILGLVAADEGDLARARELFDECARTFGDLGDRHSALWAARFLAWMYHDLGDLVRARAQHEDNLRRARALNNKSIEAATLGALGEYAFDEGRIRDGVSMVKEACATHRDLGDRFNVGTGLCRFARALVLVGRPERAVRLLSCSEAIHEDLGTRPLPWLAEYNERTIADIRTQLDEAAFAGAWEQGWALTADEAVALALDTLG